MKTGNTTVLVADDHPLMLQAVCSLIENIPSLTIIGTAQNGAEALMFLGKEKPDIAILDIDMPLMDGLEVIRSARQSNIRTNFIVLTLHKEPSMIRKVMELEVMGYLVKEDSSTEITECIEHVRHGKKYFSRSIDPEAIVQKGSVADSLTDTELKIVRLIGKGMSSQEIADLLFVSSKTIENHRSNICRKLDLDGKHNSLVKWAIEHKDEL
jgi:DNA-binding NarL/FixJ family response regulator